MNEFVHNLPFPLLAASILLGFLAAVLWADLDRTSRTPGDVACCAAVVCLLVAAGVAVST